jgi:hypothetical protein
LLDFRGRVEPENQRVQVLLGEDPLSQSGLDDEVGAEFRVVIVTGVHACSMGDNEVSNRPVVRTTSSSIYTHSPTTPGTQKQSWVFGQKSTVVPQFFAMKHRHSMRRRYSIMMMLLTRMLTGTDQQPLIYSLFCQSGCLMGLS